MPAKQTLTVFEHQRLRLGQVFETASGQVPLDPRSFELLSRFAEQSGALRLGYRSVVTTQYVGTVDIGRIKLEILPKVSDSNKADDWRALLAHMVLYSENISSRWAPNTSVRVRQMDLLQVLTAQEY